MLAILTVHGELDGQRRGLVDVASRRRCVLDERAKLQLSGSLDAGESLVWTGIPKQGFLLRASDGFMIPFSLIWVGFMVFWEASVIQGDAPRPQPFAAWYAGMQWPGMGRYQTPAFELIDDAKRVYTLLMERQRNAV